jgi:hypothetical protein
MIALIEDLLARLFGKHQEMPIRVRVDEGDKQNPFEGRK